MPAHQPSELHARMVEAFNAGDLEGCVALYEPQATFVPSTGQVAVGTEAIQGVLRPVLALKGTFEITEPTVVTAGELALLRGGWALRATAPDGSAVRRAGRMAAVARRQADGSWRLVIDNAYSGG